MIPLETTADGVLLAIHAQPGARREGIVGVRDGRLKVAVTAAAEKGKANQALREVLARGLALRKSQIELVAGPTSREKRFLIRDATEAELAAKIAAALE